MKKSGIFDHKITVIVTQDYNDNIIVHKGKTGIVDTYFNPPKIK